MSNVGFSARKLAKQAIASCAVIGIGATAVVAVDTGHAMAATCSVEKLPVPKQVTSSWVSTGAPSGEYLAGTGFDDDGWHAMLWHDDAVHRVSTPLDNETITAVNSDGLAVGHGMERNPNKRVSFTYDNGTYTELPTVSDDGDATVTAVNENGTTAVGREMIWNNGAIQHVPVRWTGPRLQHVERLPVDQEGVASDVADSGTVVGYRGGSPGTPQPPQAYLWYRDGSGKALPVIGDYNNSQATVIAGQYVLGDTSSSADDYLYLIWDLKADEVDPLPAEVYSAADMNSSGAVAVSTTDDRAAIVDDGEVHTLPDFGDGASAAYTIFEDGTAAGDAQSTDGTNHAVVWTGCKK